MIDYTLPLDELPDPLLIEPLTKPFDVTITPPGSKSITCRAYVLAALADGESKLIRPLRADDTDRLLDALCTLGAEARWEGEDVYIKGVNGRFPRGGKLYMGDGGAPTRFMIAAACLAAEPVTIDASPRMRERPIAEGVEMLRQLGARIEYVEEDGRLPVRVEPNHIRGGTLVVNQAISSQFISAVILISASLPTGVELKTWDITSASYLVLTINVLQEFGIPATRNLMSRLSPRRLRFINVRPQRVIASEYKIESDASSALYWATSAKLVPRSGVFIDPLPPWSSQPDMRAIYTLDALGGSHTPSEDPAVGVYGIYVEGPLTHQCKSVRIKCDLMPDGGIALAVGASAYSKRVYVTGLTTLAFKETDRITALANELRRIGCTVETTDDSITITPPGHGRDARATDTSATEPVVIETYNDHRMAMSFAVLGLVRPRISIRNPACVSKSYPTFWKDFAKLYQ